MLKIEKSSKRKSANTKTGRYVCANFHIERNGNGRDYDIIPSFAGAQKDSFILRFEITAGEGVSVARTVAFIGLLLGCRE